MPKITFTPSNQSVEVNDNAKILAAAIRSKIVIRYGCASCRCGTCGVKIANFANLSDRSLSPMREDEKEYLQDYSLILLKNDDRIRVPMKEKVRRVLSEYIPRSYLKDANNLSSLLSDLNHTYMPWNLFSRQR